MWNSPSPRDTLSLESRCYRLTDLGRACIDLVDTEPETVGSLSRHLHDVLMLCGTGLWFEQLRQFMPPRSLDAALRSLLRLGLIEIVHPDRDASPPWREGSRTAWSHGFASWAPGGLAPGPA